MVQWVRGLAARRRSFAALGFHVPGLALAFIEGTRERGAAERSYDSYLDEVLREYLALPRYWSAEVRLACPNALRSQYLDFLQREIDKGNFEGVNKAHASGVLDPNFILYHRMPFQDRLLADHWRSLVMAQKQGEVRDIKGRVDGIVPAPNTITISRLVDLFERISDSLSFARIERRMAADVLVSATPICETPYPVILEWTDIALTRKHGNVQLHFVAGGSNPKRIPIQSIVPGGDTYCLNNEDWYSVALAVLSHLELLKLLTIPRSVSL